MWEENVIRLMNQILLEIRSRTFCQGKLIFKRFDFVVANRFLVTTVNFQGKDQQDFLKNRIPEIGVILQVVMSRLWSIIATRKL